MNDSAETSTLLITDFSTTSDLGWYVVNDNVMGGRSEGGFRIDGSVLAFEGITNTNGGGFASIRTRPGLPSLTGRTDLILHARGDDRRYVLRLENADGIAYWAEFAAPEDDFAAVNVPLRDLRPRFRGRWLEGPPFDAERVVAIGLMCYDGRDGPFRLEVRRIEAQ